MNTPAIPDRATLGGTTIAALSRTADDSAAYDRYAAHIKHLLRTVDDREVGSQTLAERQKGVTRDILSAVLDVLATPVVLADGNLDIIDANTAAKQALVAGSSIWACNGRLATATAEQSKLRHAIAAAVRGSAKPTAFVIQAAGTTPTGVWVQPVDAVLRTSAPVWAHGLAAVIFKPMRHRSGDPQSLLSAHFGLTAKQAEVVARLAAGATLDEIAQSMGIGLATARSHLAQCFVKTSTRRQPDLVCLALSLQAPILE